MTPEGNRPSPSPTPANNTTDISAMARRPQAQRPTPGKSKKKYAYGNGLSKHLGVILKIVSFVVALALLAASGVGALILYRLDNFFKPIAFAVLIIGAVIATISLIVFYGMGHIICQNNEILSKMNRR